MVAIGYLGPPGSHTHQALLRFAQAGSLTADIATKAVPSAQSFSTLGLVLQALRQEAITDALLPYENALEGSVAEVVEALGKAPAEGHAPLRIQADILYPIRHALLQPAAYQHETITTVRSHPQALAQCRETLIECYGEGLQFEPVASTSLAAQQLGDDVKAGQKALAHSVAIATETAADLYGLSVLSPQISDVAENVTRFVWISSQAKAPLVVPEGSSAKTSLCVHLPEYPGVLMEFLSILQAFKVNLTRLESRPTRQRYGEYCFYLDAEGDLSQVAGGVCLEALRAFSKSLTMQGPYPHLGDL